MPRRLWSFLLLVPLDTDARFADPDKNGHITCDEWTKAALVDLIMVAFAIETGDAVMPASTLIRP